jgi:hypothetical protein
MDDQKSLLIVSMNKIPPPIDDGADGDDELTYEELRSGGARVRKRRTRRTRRARSLARRTRRIRLASVEAKATRRRR